MKVKTRERIIWLADLIIALVTVVWIVVKKRRKYIIAAIVLTVIAILAILTLLGLMDWFRIISRVVEICRVLGFKI